MAVDKYEIPDENLENAKTKKVPFRQERNTPFGINDEYRPAVNVKNLTKLFTEGKLQFSSRYVRAEINIINSANNTFQIDNAKLDDKYTVPLSKDFDIYIKGLLLPFDIYTVTQSGLNVVITFKENELNYSEFCADDVALFGKFAAVDIDEITTYLTTENDYYLLTEDEKLLII
jgi:hypothetical protein